MFTLEYQDGELDRIASSAVDRREPFEILVRGRKAKTVKKSILLYRKYLEAKESGKRKRSSLLKFACYGIRCPVLWGIYIHAEQQGIKIGLKEDREILTLSFSD